MDNNVQKEQEFMALLQKTLKQARGNGGFISRDEIKEIFDVTGFSDILTIE